MRHFPLYELDQRALRTVLTFLDGRLGERGTIEWAIGLGERHEIERLAVLQLLDSPQGHKLAEPWRSAWRLIEESWNARAVEPDGASRAYRVQRRLHEGDRSGSLIEEINSLVAPRLNVTAARSHFGVTEKRPRKVTDLVSVSIKSGRLLDLQSVRLGELDGIPFLSALANSLDASVSAGLDLAHRIGVRDRRPFRAGLLHRVYYVPAADLAGQDDPDRFVIGIAPVVKLLHAVVDRLSQLAPVEGLQFVRRWRLRIQVSVYRRLWAAMARDPQIATPDEVAAFLRSIDVDTFWDLHNHPEVTELRARRFADLSQQDQSAILARIRRLPPRRKWQRGTVQEIESYRTRSAAKELRRIELTGVTLPDPYRAWLDEQRAQFPALVEFNDLDGGFPRTFVARWTGSDSDLRFDGIEGEIRLEALQTALANRGGAWDDDPAEGARAWLRQTDNVRRVLSDLNLMPDGGAAFPMVWEQFGWTHSPPSAQQVPDPGGTDEALQVVTLLQRVPDETLRQSIDGIAHWYSSWAKVLAPIPAATALWLTLWPIAVESTNATAPPEHQDLDAILRPADNSGLVKIDTLNNPAGKLVEFFLALCPSLADEPYPFAAEGSPLRTIRDALMRAGGRAGLIVRHWLLEQINYLLAADREWTEQQLIAPLRAETSEGFSLWQAIARRPVSHAVMRIIGNTLSERAADTRLDRETRQALIFSLVLEALYALKEGRPPVVEPARIQQTLRSVEGEVRSHAANTVRQFVSDLSKDGAAAESPTAEELFRNVAAPFLKEIWPLERSLVTSGVSHAFARLPAAAGYAFAEAVTAVDRYLVPFDCWSMMDYGFYGNDEDGHPKLPLIDSPARAEALLLLLDRTVGTTVGAVVPMDLSAALRRIQDASPQLVRRPEFQRLATAARRA